MVLLRGYPNIVPYESSRKIIEQMEKAICQIKIENIQATGFFCRIPFPDKNNMLPVLITNNHIINGQLLYQNDATILLKIKDESQIIQLCLNNRIKYTNEKFDITIIEIQKNDSINDYLELDDIINKDIFNNFDNNKEYCKQSIYVMQYFEGKLGVSYGILDNIYMDKEYRFTHKCCTGSGSSGSPIVNIYTNKVIGLCESGHKNFNVGTFLNYPIKDFIKINCKNNEDLLKEFNKKYNLNIRDTKIEKIDLRWKGLGNIGLEDLCKIEFKELKELILNNNNISEIKILEKAKFEKLEILDLSQNKISNINIFENVNFEDLKQLYLGYNNISDIKVFERANFENLEILYLNENKIDKKKSEETISYLKSKIGNFEV